METQTHDEPKAAHPFPDAGEMLEDELDVVVGGLERIWLPGEPGPLNAWT